MAFLALECSGQRLVLFFTCALPSLRTGRTVSCCYGLKSSCIKPLPEQSPAWGGGGRDCSDFIHEALECIFLFPFFSPHAFSLTLAFILNSSTASRDESSLPWYSTRLQHFGISRIDEIRTLPPHCVDSRQVYTFLAIHVLTVFQRT